MNLFSTKLARNFHINFNIIRYDTHIIALMANADLKKLQPVINKVRTFVIKIRRSSKKKQELLNLAEKLQIKYKRDIKTRWNSTYSMLKFFLINKLIINSV